MNVGRREAANWRKEKVGRGPQWGLGSSWGKAVAVLVGVSPSWALEEIAVHFYDGPFLGSPVGGRSGRRR